MADNNNSSLFPLPSIPRALPFFPSPQAHGHLYGQSNTAARKRPLRRRESSYGSWKIWKVLEFYYGIFQDWKVLEKGHWSWKVLEIC